MCCIATRCIAQVFCARRRELGSGIAPALFDRPRVGWPQDFLYSSQVPNGEEKFYSGIDPESCITEYTLVYEEYHRGSVDAAYALGLKCMYFIFHTCVAYIVHGYAFTVHPIHVLHVWDIHILYHPIHVFLLSV
jgi:hypothetical protein